METLDSSSTVNLKEVETTFLNTQVVTPFCVSWSKDGNIFVIVEGGVFIYKLCPNPLSGERSVSFLKSWIPANSSVPLFNVVDNDNGTFLWSLDRKQAYEACIDSTLSYGIQKPNSSGITQVIQCEFSPLIGCKSYISCLTNHGLLEIYKNNLKKWVAVMNITQLWISHCSFKDNQKKIDYNSFKSEMFKLKIITMKWVEEPEIIFLTGHENGDIVFWKVQVMNGDFGMNVLNYFKTDGKPICLHLCKLPHYEHSYLFIGLLSGIVKCVALDLNSYMNHAEFIIWKDKDYLLPNLIVTKYILDKFFVFTVKHHILLIQVLSANNTKQLELMDTQWEEFPTSITGWNEYQDSFIISLQNHDVYMLTPKYNEKKIIHEKRLVDTGIKKKHKNSFCCFGFALSPNKAIWLLVSSPKQNYDTLKETTHLFMYSPELKVFRTLSDSTSSGLIEKILNEYKFIQLNEIFDLLELKKLELLLNVSNFTNSFEINKSSSLVNLQLMLWEAKLKLCCNFMNMDSLVTDLEFSITRNRAKKVVNSLQSCDSLTLLQKKSLNICEMFLKNVRDKDWTLNEVCTLCGCESFCYNIRISSCSNLHKFPRCCLSLLPCDLVPYSICGVCESVALMCFVVEGDNRCPYCDGLLELNTRFRSTV